MKKFCMFVSTECFRRNPKQFTYDKSLPKGSNTERLVSLFLEHSVNPKGKLAYKLFSTMTEEKKFVADSHTSVSTSHGAISHHSQKFYQTIERFYDFANSGDFIALNNDLLDAYLKKQLKRKDANARHIQDIVYTVNLQNHFIATLKENWELYKLYKKPKIKAL